MIIRLLALLALLWSGRHVVKQVASALHPNQQNDADASKPPDVGDDMVKDPICLTYIPKSLARHARHDGQDYYFCSDECAGKFAEQHLSSPAS